MSSIEIINLHPSRWEESKALRLEALQQEPLAFGSSYEESLAIPDNVWQDRINHAYDRTNQVTVYAEVDGRLIGMMGAFWNNRPKMAHVASIYGVYLAPVYRGQGIGKRLLQALLDELRMIPQLIKANLMVNPTQVSAQRLYERVGFQLIGISHKELKVDGQYYDELLMELLF